MRTEGDAIVTGRRRLVLATFATEMIMGAQVYERAVDQRAEEALAADGRDWSVDRTVVRSLRSPLSGTRRMPVKFVLGASPRVRSLLAQALYPGADIVHRMKVGLPPAPDRDVLTLHDIGPWRFSDEARPVPAAREELRRARAIVTPSEFSASEIVDLFGTTAPVVIPNGFDRERFSGAQPLPGSVLDQLGVRGEYVVTAGGASQRKNLEGLARAWPMVRAARPQLMLVLAGPPHPRRTSLFAALPGVAMVGRVSDALLPGLMAGSRAVVVPSLYEGFGLPALEGLAVGVPVVAMRASSLPEVIGDAGILVEPDSHALAEGVIWATSGDSDVDRRSALGPLRAAEFSWDRSIAAHVALWSRVAG